MVYQKDFVAVVSCDGKILREERHEGVDIVKIPFGSHYAIRLKNLSNKKCRVKIEIDGRNIAGDRYFLIEPNTEQMIERFLEDNMNEGHKFKFIKKTQEISNYRGDRIDDGIIRIEYEFQQPPKTILNEGWLTRGSSGDNSGNYWFTQPFFGNINHFDDGHQTYNCNIDNYVPSYERLTSEEKLMANKPRCMSRSLPLEEGITAKGEQSKQKFQEIHDYAIYEDKRVINIRLMGIDSKGNEVIKPIVTTQKLTCENCGRSTPSFNSFCPNCGTALK